MGAAQPDTRGLKGALHCHTTKSDGKLTPDEVLKVYRDLGFDFIALTDHDFLIDKEDLLRYGNHALTYRAVDRRSGQSIQNSLSATPPAAQAPMTARMVARQAPSNRTTAAGTKLPAMRR